MSKEQNRELYPLAAELVDACRKHFKGIQLEFCRNGANQMGKEFKGVEVNPVISDKFK